MSSDESGGAPWGHKINLHVYVEGTIEDALDVGERLAAVEDERIDFMGTTVAVVQTRPRDQGAH